MLVSVAQALSLRLERTLELAGASVLALLLATVTLSVLLRYAVASGFTGAEEAASWLLVALVSIGLPLALTAKGCGSICSRDRRRLEMAVIKDYPRGLELLFDDRGTKPFSSETWFVPQGLRAVFFRAVTMLACIVVISGSGQAALDLGGVSPSLGLSEGLRPAMLSAGGVLAIVAILLRHVADGRLVVFASILAIAVGLHWMVGAVSPFDLVSVPIACVPEIV
ncbi:hypothetical protein HT585_12975 [Ensifer sp. HO-A22]|uniref:Uncharacterized protein n=1 Tax=Ensifer oleiphilus TaxID=2742698 RepID=A0A7Y6Q6J2_9HYPH|nr:hypothetical protein [Ensifer oleiphilus]NVD39775.1 hypothetical protein [Ensifer oleiphilus]